MVSVTHKTPRLILLLLTLAVLWLAGQQSAFAQGALHFLTVRRGQQEAAGDSLFQELEKSHGPLQGERKVEVTGFEYDVFASKSGGLGMGLGLDIHSYAKSYLFRDPNNVLPPLDLYLSANGVLFSLKTYLQYGDFLPYFGLGLGNYYINYRQSDGLSTRQSVDNVYVSKLGFRYTIGHFSLVYDYA